MSLPPWLAMATINFIPARAPVIPASPSRVLGPRKAALPLAEGCRCGFPKGGDMCTCLVVVVASWDVLLQCKVDDFLFWTYDMWWQIRLRVIASPPLCSQLLKERFLRVGHPGFPRLWQLQLQRLWLQDAEANVLRWTIHWKNLGSIHVWVHRVLGITSWILLNCACWCGKWSTSLSFNCSFAQSDPFRYGSWFVREREREIGMISIDSAPPTSIVPKFVMPLGSKCNLIHP